MRDRDGTPLGECYPVTYVIFLLSDVPLIHDPGMLSGAVSRHVHSMWFVVCQSHSLSRRWARPYSLDVDVEYGSIVAQVPHVG